MSKDTKRPLPADCEREALELIQADLDDETPERLGAVVEDLLAAGALDAVLVPIIMKKGRPGVRLDVLARHEDRERLAAVVLRETSTLGLRVFSVHRYALARRQEVVPAFDQPVRVKLALWDGKPLKAKPEADDVRRVATTAGVTAREVEAAVRRRLDDLHVETAGMVAARKKRGDKKKPRPRHR